MGTFTHGGFGSKAKQIVNLDMTKFLELISQIFESYRLAFIFHDSPIGFDNSAVRGRLGHLDKN